MGSEAWGWDEGWATEWAARDLPPGALPARVVQEHRDRWEVAVGGETRTATTPAAGPQHASGLRPAVGDWVAVREGGARGSLLVVDLLPRRTAFRRGAAGRPTVDQVVAANVDTAWIVHGLDAPLNPRRLERYLTLAWESGARPVVVLTKADLAGDPGEVERAVSAIAPGVPVRVVSTHEGDTLSALRPDLAPGSTVALLGPSGVGKSSLANALLEGGGLPVGAVREGDRKGRHTTTWRQLVRLPGGALLLDTPGMRELQLTEVDEGLDLTFADIAELASGCRYGDCSHTAEPGCAVKEAVGSGALDPGRLESFRKLRAEADYQRRKSDVLARHAEVSRVKAIHRSMRHHLKRKEP